MSRGKQAQSQNTKNLIYEQATRLFKEHGFYHVTIEDITSAAGVAVGSFYYHFRCKEDLVYVWADELDKQYAAFYEARLADPNRGDALQMLQDIMLRTLELYSQWGAEFAAISYSYMMRNPEINDRMVSSFRVYNRIVRELVEQGQQTGLIRNDIDAERIVKNVTKCNRGGIIDWCIGGGKNSIIEETHIFVETFIKGIRA